MVNDSHPINIVSIFTMLILKKNKELHKQGFNSIFYYKHHENLQTQTKHYLTKFFGTLYVNRMHYVSAFIDTESKRIYTCVSLPYTSNYQTDKIILMKKWIAKLMSLIDYHIKNNETGLDLYFGSDNMAAGVEFNDDIEKKLKNQGQTYLMYDHDSVSITKGIPL